MKFVPCKKRAIKGKKIKIGLVLEFNWGEDKSTGIVVKRGNWFDNYDPDSQYEYGDLSSVWVLLINRSVSIETLNIEHSKYFKPITRGGSCGYISDYDDDIELVGCVDKKEIEELMVLSKLDA